MRSESTIVALVLSASVLAIDAFFQPSIFDSSVLLSGNAVCRRPKMPSLCRLSARLIPPPPPPRFNEASGPAVPSSSKPISPLKAPVPYEPRAIASRPRDFATVDDVLPRGVSNAMTPRKDFAERRAMYGKKSSDRAFRKSSRQNSKPVVPPPMLTRNEWLKAATIGGASKSQEHAHLFSTTLFQFFILPRL
jgi:hypothetical protein